MPILKFEEKITDIVCFLGRKLLKFLHGAEAQATDKRRNIVLILFKQSQTHGRCCFFLIYKKWLPFYFDVTPSDLSDVLLTFVLSSEVFSARSQTDKEQRPKYCLEYYELHGCFVSKKLFWWPKVTDDNMENI